MSNEDAGLTPEQADRAWTDLTVGILQDLSKSEIKEWVMLGKAAGRLNADDVAFFFYAFDLGKE